MTKKQVISMSFLVALPAAALILFYVYSSMFGNLFNASGLILTLVLLTGLLALVTFLLPFFVMAWYPAEGFAALAPPPPPGPEPGESGSDQLEDDDEYEDDEEGGFDDGGFDDEYGDEDGEEEMFDDGYDDDADFDEDEDDLW